MGNWKPLLASASEEDTATTRRKPRGARRRKSPTEPEEADEPETPETVVEAPAEPVAPAAAVEEEEDDEDEGELVDEDEEEDDDYEYYYDDDEEDDDEDDDEPSIAFPRQDEAVTVAVQDVRSLVGGRVPAAPSNPVTTTSTTASNFQSSATPTATTPSSNFGSSSNSNDALEQLLADAKKMQLEERGSGAVGGGDEDSFSIPNAFRSIISTIVTVDFFVVCGLLVWFLAGIFSSYVMDDDTIQISFNGIFESIVQPALGILMIAAVAGSFFKEDEDEKLGL
mmetsp:Transcript_33379/g.69518  ORF Transcript_33379/g.69518 Transcript_33379/m.69518 type:complete len:282 (-) Transcript_33379:353-1198(-)